MGEKYGIYCSEFGLFCLTFYSLVPSIFSKMTFFVFFLSTHCIYSHFLYLSVNWHLDSFSNLAFVDSVAINVGVHTSLISADSNFFLANIQE